MLNGTQAVLENIQKRTPEETRRILVEIGVINEGGQLTAHYQGGRKPMSERKFVKVSKKFLEQKISAALEAAGEEDLGFLPILLEKDLKVKFDRENFDGDARAFPELKQFLGLHTLSSGLTFWGFHAGGDWEYPVCFIVYWDGKKLRGYVPTDGNPYNTTTKRAYGNDDEADRKNAKRRWGVKLDDGELDPPGDWLPEDTSSKKMLADIKLRFVESV